MKYCILIFFYLFLNIKFVFSDVNAQEKIKVGNNKHQTTRPQFQKTQIKINKINIRVEIADTSEKQAFGLMFVQKLAENEGMLFVFEKEDYRSFWMKNTLIPLSIGYFDKNKKLMSMHEMIPENKPDFQLKSYPSFGLAKYALEMNSSWYLKNKVKIGDSFSFE